MNWIISLSSGLILNFKQLKVFKDCQSNKISMKYLYYLSLFLMLSSCSYLADKMEYSSGIKFSETAEYIYIQPALTAKKNTAIIFYPGGLVAPSSYIKTFEEIVSNGYSVVLAKQAANLAILDNGKATDFVEKFDGIDRWLLGGHSLGAVVAAINVNKNQAIFPGLILMAGYPTESASLKGWNGAVLSLYAEYDALATPSEIAENKPYLPDGTEVVNLLDMPSQPSLGTTIYHEIKGGNHSQFGSYGAQNGDGVASISPTVQQKEVTDFILSFMTANGW